MSLSIRALKNKIESLYFPNILRNILLHNQIWGAYCVINTQFF